ncbi:NADH-quinone oxidoreductase subunit N [Planctomicrobium sp. SH661]|uniref:NADH-quinone oxidoreductase subunit N n=1 Tax=Planctomicrobium sp. SH661 TaxID=3448124 RepID=UPI003F5C5A57
MSVPQILTQFREHEIPRSLEIFAPEMLLCFTIVLLLLFRMTGLSRKLPVHLVALLGTLVVFIGVFTQFMFLRVGAENSVLKALYDVWGTTAQNVGTVGPYFTGLLVHDVFAVFFRLGLSLFLVFVVALTILSGIPDQDDGQDFYTLLLGATLGMMLAAGSNHLLMLFLSVEMMSVPSYAMVAFQKGRKKASEAALKYVVYGAGAAGVMLYGISLLAGLAGTASMPELAGRISTVVGDGALVQTNATTVTLVLAILMVLAGLAFKLSLVPFHFWCPDAFEGASAEVCGFLSVASKAAAFALLVRFVLAFQGSGELLHQIGVTLGIALGFISIITCTYGNLAAYVQNNLKRMLAYSTIAHAGYMVMAVSAMLILLNAPGGPTAQSELDASGCLEGLMYYLAVYLFMNLGAFACVAMIRNETFSEEIDAYRGLFHGNGITQFLCICLACCFFSLIGIPPMGGFFGKLAIFRSVYSAGNVHWFLWVVLAFGALNTVISLFYYMRVLKAMFLAEPAAERRKLQLPGVVGAYIALITLPVILLGASPLMAYLSSTAQYVATSILH